MTKNSIFERNCLGITEKLLNKTVAIAGLGGLGSNVAVALVRAGIGKLIIADFDKVELSNLNRQYYFHSDLGRLKSEALRDHLININPDIKLEVHNKKLKPSDIIKIFKDAEILIEAFDLADRKKWLIETWAKNYPNKPVVSGNGLSGMGHTKDMKVIKAGHIYFCGDGTTEMKIGLLSSRVAIVANMQANVCIELLLNNSYEVS
ncbi:MAG TPA: sulfur carrier protein ThiS adenylyltransferase ThiF [Victivallales bacterium]|nr:sulfur carrier protein ThiS adenylyltransferase ThiF [Victivallales bacterium]